MWTSVDREIWRKTGSVVAAGLLEFLHPEREELIQCASLYHGGPLKGLRSPLKEIAEQQRRGWFSLWRRGESEWVDLLTEHRFSAPPDRPGQVALARALPHEGGWQLHFPSRERLTLEEAEPLLRRLLLAKEGPNWLQGVGAIEFLRLWFQRRELVLGPLEEFEVHLLPRRQGPALEKLLSALRPPATQDGKHFVFSLQTPESQHLDDHPLMKLAHSIGEVDEYWRGVATVPLNLVERNENLSILIEAQQFRATLRFPGSLTFQSLHRAICCLFGSGMEREYFEFKLSLDRLVSPDDHLGLDESFQLISETQRLHKHLHPGCYFQWGELRLHLLPEKAEPGPSPWYTEGPHEANLRLRRAFHSRLGKVMTQAAPAFSTEGQTQLRLAGLGGYCLDKLKVKEAMVACLIEAGQPLSLPQIANYLQLEGFPLAKGLESLKKAWRRDSIIREDSLGRLQIVAGAVLLDSWLMLRLSGAASDSVVAQNEPLAGIDPAESRLATLRARELSNQALTHKLQGLFSLNARPKPNRIVVASQDVAREVCRWRVLPDGKPREGKLRALIDSLKDDDLLVTDLEGLGVKCQVLEIESSRDRASATLGRFSDGRLVDLEALYLYGCLHGYVLTKSGRRPVDWRSQDQPDLWERLFRLKNSPQVTFHSRGSGQITLIQPRFCRDGTQHSNILIHSQAGWEAVAEDDVLAIEAT